MSAPADDEPTADRADLEIDADAFGAPVPAPARAWWTDRVNSSSAGAHARRRATGPIDLVRTAPPVEPPHPDRRRYFLSCFEPGGEFEAVIVAVTDAGRRRYFTSSDGARLVEVDELSFEQRRKSGTRSMLEIDERELRQLEDELGFARPLRGRDPIAELRAETAASLEATRPMAVVPVGATDAAPRAPHDVESAETRVIERAAKLEAEGAGAADAPADADADVATPVDADVASTERVETSERAPEQLASEDEATDPWADSEPLFDDDPWSEVEPDAATEPEARPAHAGGTIVDQDSAATASDPFDADADRASTREPGASETDDVDQAEDASEEETQVDEIPAPAPALEETDAAPQAYGPIRGRSTAIPPAMPPIMPPVFPPPAAGPPAPGGPAAATNHSLMRPATAPAVSPPATEPATHAPASAGPRPTPAPNDTRPDSGANSTTLRSGVTLSATDAVGQVALAKGISFVAHRGRLDKSGLPYFDHPGRIAERFDPVPDPIAAAAAWLHDVLEDTPITSRELLEAGVLPDVVEVVELLTRRPEVSPDEYYAGIRRHPVALRVKLADIADNTAPWRLRRLDFETQRRLDEKYRYARRALGAD